MKRSTFLGLVALFILSIVSMQTVYGVSAYSGWVGTGTTPAETSTKVIGFGSGTGNSFDVTASSTAPTNILASLPSNDYQYVAIRVMGASAAVYLNGTVATPTLGFPLKSGDSPLILPLPVLPKSRAAVYVIGGSGGELVRCVGYKTRD